MSKIEINELEWYCRDFLFKNHNKGVLELETKTIPMNMIETYLRYRNADLGHISSILEIVLENLILSNFIEHKDNFVGIRDGISRLQCSKCHYICYLGNLESKVCFRCRSNELGTFPKKH
ncbi:MAG TPA: hypothetical protein VHH33_02840 [Nitrososphaeraceae archaeon]|jgi:hypothetical protein|nr:hypothetical protein [Nitrososphaeraceae archaeon]